MNDTRKCVFDLDPTDPDLIEAEYFFAKLSKSFEGEKNFFTKWYVYFHAPFYTYLLNKICESELDQECLIRKSFF